MGRDIDIDERDPEPSATGRSRGAAGSGHTDVPDDASAAGNRASLGRVSGRSTRAGGASVDRAGDPRAGLDHALPRGLDGHRVVLWRDRVVNLSPSESATLRTLGAFRTVALSDLARHQYDGQRGHCRGDLRRLTQQRFVEARTLPGRHGGRATPVVTLTREGHAFAARYLSVEGQRLHWGLVRPKEQAHDAALYRMAVAESERLARSGATVRRVVLDAELKGQLATARNRHVSFDRPAASDSADATARTLAAAEALNLPVVDGHVQIPDLRLEYETREGTVARVDLELATEHYRPDQVAAKARAGFTIYAPASQTQRLAAALHDRGLVADILSL